MCHIRSTAVPTSHAGSCLRLVVAARTPVTLGVSNTHAGVSNTRAGVSNTRVGISNTRMGVLITLVSVSNTRAGVSNTRMGVLITLVSVSNTRAGVSNTPRLDDSSCQAFLFLIFSTLDTGAPRSYETTSC